MRKRMRYPPLPGAAAAAADTMIADAPLRTRAPLGQNRRGTRAAGSGEGFRLRGLTPRRRQSGPAPPAGQMRQPDKAGSSVCLV
ncbi:unnamed protein product [Gadus morhua 'NCC']